MRQYKLKWVIDKQHSNMLVREFLMIHQISKRALAAIKFSGGSILVNGKNVTVRYSLQPGDILEVRFPPEEKNEQLKGENIPLSILYEDKDIIILNKPAHMNTIPSREHPTGSLANALQYYYEKHDISSSIHIVTRLDRDTSGIVLVAKHRYAHHLFSLMQKEQQIERFYEALAEGVFKKKKDTIDAPIGRKATSIIQREVRADGQKAVTHYEVITQYSHFAHIGLKLETGRTHQIRVHMEAIGHPLLGDDLYGGSRELISRQALHCKKIRFFHPFLQKDFFIECPLPEDMQIVLNKQKGGSSEAKC